MEKTKKPRLLVLLSRVPFPLDKGDKLRAYHQIQGLSKNYRIILVCLNTGKVNTEAYKALNPHCEYVRFIQLNIWGIGLRLTKNIFSKRPYQVAYFHSPQAQKELDQIIETYLPQRFFCQLIRVAEYARKYTIFSKSIDYMDALSAGMERRIKLSNPLFRPIIKSEAKRLKEYESEVFNNFQHQVIISDQDRNLLDHPSKNDVRVIPNGIAESYFEEVEADKDYDLCFTGNMSYPPNIEGAQYLVKKILPLLKSEEVKILISGKSPKSNVKRLSGKQVTVTGWVEDMRLSYAQSKIFVAPMVIGSGLQNKLLEAMAAGIPCITTSLANKALDAKHNESILIADTPEAFAQHIKQLLNNKSLRHQIGENGREFVRENYTWEHWNGELSDMIEQL